MKTVLLDLAGVIMDFGGLEWYLAAAGPTADARDFGRFWAESSTADRFYRGQITPEEFAVGAVTDLGLEMPPPEFLSQFRRWLRGPYPGSLELIESLLPQTTTACLSNTNEVEVGLFTELGLRGVLHRCFFSNEIGLRKPDRRCYEHVLEELRCQPDQVVFFDDSQSCVDGARRVGIESYRVEGVEALRVQLHELGFEVAAGAGA